MKTKNHSTRAFVALVALCACPWGLAAQTTPKKADDFVASIGLNIKLDRARYKDNNGFSARVKPAMRDLGIRHTRGAHFAHPTYGPQRRQLWNEYGIRALYVTGPYEGGLTPQGVQRNAEAGKAYMYAVEGANEPDIFLVEGFGWPNHKYTDRKGKSYTNTKQSYPATRAWHQDMVHYLKQDSDTRNMPIVTTPMAFASNVPKIVPITHDLTSFHHYTHRAPVTHNLNADITRTRRYAQGGANKPMLLTEFGWRTGGKHAVSEKTQAKNILTAYCEYFNRGIRVSYLHELVENAWGLMNNAGRRKPAFNGLRNLIDLLGEATFDKSKKQWRKPSFTPKAVSYQLLDKHNSTNQLLLQKSNGNYFLLLWRNVDRSNDDGSDISNWEDGLTLKVNGNMANVVQYRFDNSFKLTSKNLTPKNNAVEVLVPDNVTIIRFSVGLSQGYRRLENKGHRKVITARSDNNAVPVVQQSWNGFSRQQWRFINIGGGYYRIENKQNGKVLMANDRNTDGVSVNQRSWNNWNPQKWRVESVGGGYYRIVNKQNGKCIRAEPNGTANANITQHKCENWDSQKWKLALLGGGRQAAAPLAASANEDRHPALRLSPNPVATQLLAHYHHAASGDATAQVQVMDLAGRVVASTQQALAPGANPIGVDVSRLPVGTYVLLLQTGGQAHAKRFVIAR